MYAFIYNNLKKRTAPLAFNYSKTLVKRFIAPSIFRIIRFGSSVVYDSFNQYIYIFTNHCAYRKTNSLHISDLNVTFSQSFFEDEKQ